MGLNYLDSNSKQLVMNVYRNFKNHPTYSCYDISMSSYNPTIGSIDIDIYKDGYPINRFMFCGNHRGSLKSIAIFGIQLDNHLSSIKSSMRIFGLRVESVKFDDEGLSPFVDIILSE